MINLSDDQIKYAKYKWEFMRRNLEYIKDWEKLENTFFEKYGKWMGPPIGEMSKEEIEFCKKWKIGGLLPPEQSYDDYTIHFIKNLLNNGVENNEKNLAEDEQTLKFLEAPSHEDMFNRLFPESSHWRPFTVLDGWEYEDYDGRIIKHVSKEVAKTGKIAVEIDLNHSKNRLINDFKDLIGEWKELYEGAFKKFLYKKFYIERKIYNYPIDYEEDLKKEFKEIYADRLKERKTEYEKKYHFDNFDNYLKVYDLKKKGISWSKITTRLNLNSVQTARNHYSAACELIEKGINLYVK